MRVVSGSPSGVMTWAFWQDLKTEFEYCFVSVPHVFLSALFHCKFSSNFIDRYSNIAREEDKRKHND